eukprot:CAMPEP_0116961908 /NCGR_PEP_ID=MMETSP0467-20121206/46890_1 /TAXON_ID=283647 /ORGANISM="Mesodinium pulex, Strain SPMC105" /LENGTH=114 /DNA_ID=CAMNT_0004650025 /DNA_START=595 /DNA_END=941 /DNA_ORIENTATION=+
MTQARQQIHVVQPVAVHRNELGQGGHRPHPPGDQQRGGAEFKVRAERDHQRPPLLRVLGLDIMMDENFKPWLIEVNSSPSLSTTGEDDRLTKTYLINDILNIVMPKEWSKEGSK